MLHNIYLFLDLTEQRQMVAIGLKVKENKKQIRNELEFKHSIQNKAYWCVQSPSFLFKKVKYLPDIK